MSKKNKRNASKNKKLNVESEQNMRTKQNVKSKQNVKMVQKQKTENTSPHKMKRTDWIFIATILVVMIAAILVVKILFFGSEGTKAVVTVDGTVILEQDLSEDCAIPITTLDGYNKFVVKDGMAYIEEADCANQICVNHEPISTKNETIVCLPHKLVVEIQ